MAFVDRLRAEDPSSAVARHLRGLIEAHEKFGEILVELDKAYGVDHETTAEKLTELQVEIYFHHVHHMKALRAPLGDLVDAAYRRIPDFDPEGEFDLPLRPKSPR